MSSQTKPITLELKPLKIEVDASHANASQFEQDVIERLSPSSPIKIDKIFDRNGIRSTFYESEG